MNDNTNVNEHAPSKHFNEPGDSITGKLLRWERGPSRYGDDPIPIAILETDDGPMGVWLFSSVLKSKFSELKPKVGEVITIEFLGTKKSEASGFNYKSWKVTAPGRQAEEYAPPFEDWAMDSTYHGDEPGESSPWS